MTTLAFDRSERFKDQDGHLHVRATNLSKATVNPYRGSEIPNYATLGLDPARIYQLFRDPTELAKAAPTFNNLRLMSRHVAVSATDPQEKLVAGSTGTDARFESPYLVNSLVIWRQEDIDDVESQEKCQLSCGYYYDADMTPGTWQGSQYDGVMRNLRGNHVALVEAGRAGPDVLVHDSGENVMPAQPLVSRKALMVAGALRAYLRPKLLPGTVLALDSALGSVNRLNWQTQKNKVLATVLAEVGPRLAPNNKIELQDLKSFIGAFDEDDEDDEKAEDDEVEAMDAEEEREEAAARDAEEKENKSAEDRAKGAKDRRTARDKARDAKAKDAKARDKKARDKAAKDKRAKDEFPDKEDDDDEDDKAAKDARARDAKAKDKKAMDELRADVTRDAVAQMNAAIEAREIVRPLVGQVALAMDNAADIYKFALTQHKVPIDGVHPTAFKAMVGMIPKPGTVKRDPLAYDSATSGLDAMFPGISRISQS